MHYCTEYLPLKVADRSAPRAKKGMKHETSKKGLVDGYGRLKNDVHSHLQNRVAQDHQPHSRAINKRGLCAKAWPGQE